MRIAQWLGALGAVACIAGCAVTAADDGASASSERGDAPDADGRRESATPATGGQGDAGRGPEAAASPDDGSATLGHDPPPADDAGAAPPSPPSTSTCGPPCAGPERIVFHAKSQKYVKAVLCSPTRYDLFMSDSASGPFFKIGDTAGNGQDHCELVNAAFTLKNEDDVASGSCPSCQVMSASRVVWIPSLRDGAIYYRGYLGEPFRLTSKIAAEAPGADTACWYECGARFD